MRALALLVLLVLLLPAAAAKPVFRVEVAHTEKWEKPQSAVAFPIRVENDATARVRLAFEVVESTGGLHAIVPNPVELDTRGMPGARADVPLVLQTPSEPGWMNEAGRVTYRITALSATTRAPVGEPHDVSFVVHTKGFYVPAVQFFGMMAALAVAAALMRRRS
jgi:hypothetical protein